MKTFTTLFATLFLVSTLSTANSIKLGFFKAATFEYLTPYEFSGKVPEKSIISLMQRVKEEKLDLRQLKGKVILIPSEPTQNAFQQCQDLFQTVNPAAILLIDERVEKNTITDTKLDIPCFKVSKGNANYLNTLLLTPTLVSISEMRDVVNTAQAIATKVEPLNLLGILKSVNPIVNTSPGEKIDSLMGKKLATAEELLTQPVTISDIEMTTYSYDTELPIEEAIEVFPKKASDILIISYNFERSTNLTFQIQNLSGEIVKTYQLANESVGMLEVDITELKSGDYKIISTTPKATITQGVEIEH